MDKMIHINLKAMQGIMNRQTAIANNMANADTTGFRAEIVNARALYVQGEGLASRASTSEAVVGADMNAGTVEMTGGPLDIAMNGDALLGVQAADGAEAYTRRGDLMVNESGLLTTGDGFPVLGQGGEGDAAKSLNSDHGEVKAMLYALGHMDKGDPAFNETLGRLRSALEEHMRQEEDELFPALRERLSDEENKKLSREMNMAGLILA